MVSTKLWSYSLLTWMSQRWNKELLTLASVALHWQFHWCVVSGASKRDRLLYSEHFLICGCDPLLSSSMRFALRARSSALSVPLLWVLLRTLVGIVLDRVEAVFIFPMSFMCWAILHSSSLIVLHLKHELCLELCTFGTIQTRVGVGPVVGTHWLSRTH